MNTLVYKLDNENDIPELNVNIDDPENAKLLLSKLIPDLQSKVLDTFNEYSNDIKSIKLEVDFL